MVLSSNLPEGAGKGIFSQPEIHKFEFTGSTDELLPIILRNLLFNILTLSLYRFWGRTNVRRYIWENVRFKGDPFEYTGTGGELFKGFLVVLVAVFLPLFGLITWAQLLLARGQTLGLVLIFALYLFMIWLLSFGLYRAYKYRMSRTRWRGIRGTQLKSGAGYATEALSYTLFTGLSLGLLFPVMENKLWTLETNNRRFGSGRFSYNAGSGRLYVGYFKSLALTLVGFFAMSTLMVGFAPGGNPFADSSLVQVYLGFFAAYLGLLVFMGLAFSIYTYEKLKHFWSNTHFEGATFSFSGTLGGLIRLLLGNLLITILTLGIAYPIAQMRLVRFMVENLQLEGKLDLARISQTDEEAPGFGEGLAEGFDMGTI